MDGKLRRDMEEIEWKVAYLRNVKRNLKVGCNYKTSFFSFGKTEAFFCGFVMAFPA